MKGLLRPPGALERREKSCASDGEGVVALSRIRVIRGWRTGKATILPWSTQKSFVERSMESQWTSGAIGFWFAGDTQYPCWRPSQTMRNSWASLGFGVGQPECGNRVSYPQRQTSDVEIRLFRLAAGEIRMSFFVQQHFETPGIGIDNTQWGSLRRSPGGGAVSTCACQCKDEGHKAWSRRRRCHESSATQRPSSSVRRGRAASAPCLGAGSHEAGEYVTGCPLPSPACRLTLRGSGKGEKSRNRTNIDRALM